MKVVDLGLMFSCQRLATVSKTRPIRNDDHFDFTGKWTTPHESSLTVEKSVAATDFGRRSFKTSIRKPALPKPR